VTRAGRQKELDSREDLFKLTARRMLLEDGYQNMSISRVAQATGFSKKTVYQFFGSKEELVVALGLQCWEKLLDTVQKAARFPGRPRERLAAFGGMMIYRSEYNDEDHSILSLIDAEAVLNRVPACQRALVKQYDQAVFQTVLKIINEAVALGDLEFKADDTPEGLAFTLWVMMDGCLSAGMGCVPFREVGIENPAAEVVRSGHRLLDGYNWRPLSWEHDYGEVSRHSRKILCETLDKKAGLA